MKKRFQQSLLLTLLLLLGVPLGAWADREVSQLQFGKQVIEVASDEVITFYDFKGTSDISSSNQNNSHSLTVFKPAETGKSVQISFEEIDIYPDGASYPAYMTVYSGNPDANDTFTWVTTASGVTTSTVLPEGNVLKTMGGNDKTRYTSTGETFVSAEADGTLSVGFLYKYASTCKGWKATVKAVTLQNMTVTGAGSSYDEVVASPTSKQNVTLASAIVTAEGVMNPDNVTGIHFSLTQNEGVVVPTALKLFKGDRQVEATVEADGTAYRFVLNEPLSDGVNTFSVKADIEGTAQVGAKVQLDITKITTTGQPAGVQPFTAATSVVVENPALVLMSTAAQTVTVGETPLQFYDEGGINGSIKGTASGQVTFLSGVEGKKVMVDFSKIAINNGSMYYQALKIYNGTETTAANLLAELRSEQTGRVRSTAADGSLTVVLTAASQNYDYDGWEALVSLFTPQPMDFDGISTAAASTETVAAGDEHQPMLNITVKTKDTEPAMQVTKMGFSTNGTFALVSKAQLFFGTTLVGETDVTADQFDITLTTPQALVEGNNQFTLAYTVSDEAQNDQTVTAQAQSVTALVNGTAKTVEADAAVQASRTINNVVISHADQGTVTKTVNGAIEFYTKARSEYTTNYESGSDDRINIFVPKHEGMVCQIDFSQFAIYYNSYNTSSSAKFKIYSGQGTSGDVLWQPTTSDDYKNGPADVIRSTAADGALTIVFNPNNTYSSAAGFKATVKEYQSKPMQVAAVEATQTTVADASIGVSEQELLTVNVVADGNLNPLQLQGLKLNLKGTEANIGKVSVWQDESLLGEADAAADVTVTFAEPLTLKEGDNIFAVKADVKADAEENQTIDAKVVAAVVGGQDVTATEGDPEGARTLKNQLLMTEGNHGTLSLGLGKTVAIYDDGGADGDGADGVDATVTLAPTGDADCIKLYDKGIKFAYTAHLYIYNGGEVNDDNLITDLSGSSAKFDPIASDATIDGGKLTIRYVGAGSYTLPNFAIEAQGYKKTNLAVTNITAEDISVSEVLKGQTDVKMLKVAVEVKGDLESVNITGFNTTGADGEAVEAQHVYQTGRYTTFSANETFSDSYSVTAEGTYYFWICNDIKTTATVGQTVETTLTAIVANGETIAVGEPVTATVTVATGKSGDYTVGEGGTYATIQQAVDDLGTLGMDGPVTLKIKAGEYNEKVRIPYIKGMGAQNTLTLESESGERDVKIYHNQYTTSGYSDDQHKKDYGVVTVYEASYVTLRNLEITTTDATGYKALVMVKDGSRHVTIDHCYLHADIVAATSGDGVALVNHTIIDEENRNNDYLTVRNSLLEGGKYGVYMGGTSVVALPKEVGGVVEGNTFRNNGRFMMYAYDELGAKIRNNTFIIDDADVRMSNGVIDITVRNEYDEATEITGNVFNLNSSNTLAAIFVRNMEATAEAPMLIANNVVNIASANASTTALKFSSSNVKNVNVAHNTFRMTGANGGAAFWPSSKLGDGYGNVTVVNNIIQNETSGYAFNFYNDANLGSDKFLFQNNVVYAAGSTFFRAASSTSGDFDLFVEKTGATGSVNKQVTFLSDDILEPANTLDGDLLTAQPLSYVTTDVTGKERPATDITIGAYEYDPDVNRIPVMAEGYPKVLNIGEGEATIVLKTDVAATAYVLQALTEDIDEAPTADEIFTRGKTVALQGETEAMLTLDNLAPETAYTAFVALKSKRGLASESLESVAFTTLEHHVAPATIDIWMNNDHAHQTTIAEGSKANIFVKEIEGGKAPFTLTVATAYGEELYSEEIDEDDAEDYMGMFEVEPVRPTDYIVTLTDAQQNVTSDTVRVIVTGTPQIATFDDLWYDSDEDGEFDYMFGPFWMNTTTIEWGQTSYSGSFLSGSYAFYNNCIPSYGSFDGFAYSRSTETSFSKLTYAADQFNNVTGGGYNGSETFAVGYVGYSNKPTVEVLSSDGETIKGCYVTNDAYCVDAILNGDGQQNETDANGQSVAGNEGFHQGDYLLLTATGYDKQGNVTGTAEFYMADYRSTNAAEWYYVQEWKWFDLTTLGNNVRKVSFDMSATRQNTWGTTTPLYFCLDNFNDPNTTTGVSTTANNGTKAVKARYNAAGQQLHDSHRGLNIVRQQDGSIRKVFVK